MKRDAYDVLILFVERHDDYTCHFLIHDVYVLKSYFMNISIKYILRKENMYICSIYLKRESLPNISKEREECVRFVQYI